MGKDDHEHEIDGCLCDLKMRSRDAVSDIDLPAAYGGMAINLGAFEGEHIDGCGVDFEAEVTADETLPTAKGGVA